MLTSLFYDLLSKKGFPTDDLSIFMIFDDALKKANYLNIKVRSEELDGFSTLENEYINKKINKLKKVLDI